MYLTGQGKPGPKRKPEEEAVVLNFDDSVTMPDGIKSLGLRSFEERIRYVTSWSEMEALERVIKDEASGKFILAFRQQW